MMLHSRRQEKALALILVNGTLCSETDLCLNAFDRGFTLGHGIFETMLCIKGRIPLLSYHWKRLSVSAPLIGISLPFELSELQEMIQTLLMANHAGEQTLCLRLTISDGLGIRGLLNTTAAFPTCVLTSADYPLPPPSLSATVVSTRRNELSLASQIKNISYLDNILAKKEAVKQGFDEALLLNSKNYLAEGAISNLYIVHNNRIYTPPIKDGALPGVIRHLLLNELNDGTVEEQSISRQRLFDADEIFISNALLGIRPLHQLDTQLYNIFTVSQQFRQLLKNRFDYP